MIPLLSAITITRLRYPAYGEPAADGTFTRPEPVEEPIQASVQPASGREVERLPDALRGKVAKAVYSYDEVRAIAPETEQPADRLVIEGEVYEVATSERWPAWMGKPAHWRAVAVLLQPHRVQE